MSKYVTIKIDSKRYEDSDDCLADAASDYAEGHNLDEWGLEGSDLLPRWEDNERDAILLSVPARTFVVADYDSGEQLDGIPSVELAQASLDSPDEVGTVAAYRDAEGVWQLVREDMVEFVRTHDRREVITVYVE